MRDEELERDPGNPGDEPAEDDEDSDEPFHDDMIEDDADPIDTEVEDADFFLGEEGGGEDA